VTAGGGRLPREIALVALSFVVGACLADPPRPSSVPPGPSPIATARPAPTNPAPESDSIEPAPSTEPVPSVAGEPVVVAIKSEWGTLRVNVVSDGLVIKARPATDREIERLPLGDRDIAIRALGDDLLVVWIGSVCERSARLIVLPDQVFLDPAPRHGCDAAGLGYGVVLTTAVPLDPSKMLARAARPVLLP
jgi:hypothetical protein